MNLETAALKTLWRHQSTSAVGNFLVIIGFWSFLDWKEQSVFLVTMLTAIGMFSTLLFICSIRFGSAKSAMSPVAQFLIFFVATTCVLFLYSVLSSVTLFYHHVLSWPGFYSVIVIVTAAESIVAEMYPSKRVALSALAIVVVPSAVVLLTSSNVDERILGFLTIAYVFIQLARLIENNLSFRRRIHSELEVRAQSEELGRILDSVPGKVAYFDSDLRYIYANTRLSNDFGIHKELLVGKQLGDAGDTNAQLIHRRLADLLSGNETYKEFEVNLDLPQSGRRAHHFYSRTVSTINGKRVLVLSMDVQANKDMEHDLEKLREAQVMSAKLSALGEMAGGIAHEINNPLTIIRGRATQIRNFIARDKQFDPQKIQDNAQKIEAVCDRIAKIIVGLKKYSRDSSHDQKEPFMISTMIEDSLALCLERFKSRGVDLETDVTKDLNAQIWGHSTQVSQILVNLLNNAFDACAEHTLPKIRLFVELKDDHVIIRVSDNGPGVPLDIEAKIFESFFTTKAIGLGTGLGLSISLALAKDHGGTLVLNRSICNSCFELRLPIWKQELKVA